MFLTANIYEEKLYGDFKYHISHLFQGQIRSNSHKINFIFKNMIKIVLPLFVLVYRDGDSKY